VTPAAMPAVWPLEEPEDDVSEATAGAEAVPKADDDIEVMVVEDIDVCFVVADVVDDARPMVVRIVGVSTMFDQYLATRHTIIRNKILQK